MGDFEMDAMDSVDVHEDAYESERGADPLEKGDTAVDAVAELLMSGDTSKADALAESGQTAGNFSVRDDDTMKGSRDRSPPDTSFMDDARSNQSMPDMEEPGKRMEYYQQMVPHLNSEFEALQEQFANGSISQADFNHQTQFLQGKAAGAMLQYQNAQIEQMQNQQWMDKQVAAVREKHKDVFDDPVKRDSYARRGIEMLGKIGYSDAELNQIGAREYNFLMDHLKMQDRLNELEMQNKMLVKEKKQRQSQLKGARRDNEVGARGTKNQSTQIDEVMRVLWGK